MIAIPTTTNEFFSDAPLFGPMEQWHAEWAARAALLRRWAGHNVAGRNGHLIWRPDSDRRPGDMLVFYDGDYSDVLAPDDPRILMPRVECPAPPEAPRLQWDE
ncbi:hypothetical protein ASF04_07960 [Duganella sp. Leaf61]|uniref:hypothetical protein n=1 Tax=Duganella sp. Leaf61 TaxID=1736227 RepID=UPI0006FDF20E|nr:hypothetical protein [Duganella sp. Leaf61]KQN73058.1 hypothetical protein ASF04_07960 [Duganella sp. Leaf61]